MKTILALLVAFVIPAIAAGQNTIVAGMVEGARGQSIRLIACDDFISEKIITMGMAKIESNGSFSMAIELSETIMAYIDINYQRAEIFLEPGKNYNIMVTYNGENQLASYFDRQGLSYDFTDPDPENLNLLIWEFNRSYNAFVMENFGQISRDNDKDRVKAFKTEIEKAFPNIENTYFSDYITYKIAGIEQFARLKGRNLLAQEYLSDMPVLYNNVEYTFFFEEFFQKFLITSPDLITISDLIIAVNDHADNARILKAMDAVPWLADQGFRELVLLHGLNSLYFNNTYKKPEVLKMIRNISITTTDPMHRKIALNLLETLTRLSPGTPAPDLDLTGIAGQEFRLKSLRGKAILLTFFRSGQTGMTRTFDQLAELHNLYKAGLDIISISMDNAPGDYIPLANSGNYHWTFAHYGNNPQVYDLYNIKDLPLFVLIDVEGNIALCPAPLPGEKLEQAIMKIIH